MSNYNPPSQLLKLSRHPWFKANLSSAELGWTSQKELNLAIIRNEQVYALFFSQGLKLVLKFESSFRKDISIFIALIKNSLVLVGKLDGG